jgi:hypothetical protein
MLLNPYLAPFKEEVLREIEFMYYLTGDPQYEMAYRINWTAAAYELCYTVGDRACAPTELEKYHLVNRLAEDLKLPPCIEEARKYYEGRN